MLRQLSSSLGPRALRSARPLLAGSPRFLSHGGSGLPKTIPISFVKRDGTVVSCLGAPGDTLLHVAQENDLELEGACEGSVACSTCHVVLEPKVFSKIDEPTEDEDDMLDMAFGLTETSRLGCQVKCQEWMKDTKIVIPQATRNFYVDGHKPKPH